MGLLSTGLSLAGGSQIKLIFLAVAATAILGTVGGTALYVRHLRGEVAELETDNRIYKQNNETLKKNVETLDKANTANFNTVQSLIADKAQASKAISQLAAMRQADNARFDRLNGRIQDMLKDPKNDGAVAPVLREVIREVQKARDSK
jgi:cell division protein FtsB